MTGSAVTGARGGGIKVDGSVETLVPFSDAMLTWPDMSVFFFLLLLVVDLASLSLMSLTSHSARHYAERERKFMRDFTVASLAFLFNNLLMSELSLALLILTVSIGVDGRLTGTQNCQSR